jgi:hypothetical protein
MLFGVGIAIGCVSDHRPSTIPPRNQQIVQWAYMIIGDEGNSYTINAITAFAAARRI